MPTMRPSVAFAVILLSLGSLTEDRLGRATEMNANMLAIQKKQEQIDSVGGRTALDEFGIEVSPEMEKLSKTMEFVKIGRELISEVDKDELKQEEVKKLMKRLKDHDILIVAVGVETEGELRFMQKYGADFVQGFYLAKPSVAMLEVDTSLKEKIRL